MSNRILILTEVGKSIGYGHYTRCLALSRALYLRGYSVEMLAYAVGSVVIEDNVQIFDWIKRYDTLISYGRLDIVIIDSYLANEIIYTQIYHVCSKLIVIDDFNRINYKCHLIINPNVFCYNIDYSNQSSKYLGGKDYVILRDEFRDASSCPINLGEHHEILITLGGDDFRNIVPVVVESCLGTQVENINVVIPSGVSSTNIDKRVNYLPTQSAKAMVLLMQRAKIVISACGQTLHELASLGKPTIAICLDSDQIPNQKFYLDIGFIPFGIKWDDTKLSSKIQKGLAFYDSYEIRNLVSINSANIFPKNGVNNIVSAIDELL